MLPRIHGFELNDSPWVPLALRETVVESLSRTLAWGRILAGVVEPFGRFLDQTGASEVLDLCSGAGGPAAILATEMQRAGRIPPHFLLTDLTPYPEAWAKLEAAHPGVVGFVPSPIDATAIPPEVGAGRPRLIVNALHHFRPELAGAILRGACESEGSPGVFVVEGFERNPLGFVPFAVPGAAAIAVNPFRTPRRRLEKAWLTYLTPIAIGAAVWDGLMSTLRIHTEADLRAMVAPLGDAWRFTHGTYAFPWGGKGTYFYGVRR